MADDEYVFGCVGVNGKACKIIGVYTGVNGKAYPIIGGFTGIDGKAQKLVMFENSEPDEPTYPDPISPDNNTDNGYFSITGYTTFSNLVVKKYRMPFYLKNDNMVQTTYRIPYFYKMNPNPYDRDENAKFIMVRNLIVNAYNNRPSSVFIYLIMNMPYTTIKYTPGDEYSGLYDGATTTSYIGKLNSSLYPNKIYYATTLRSYSFDGKTNKYIELEGNPDLDITSKGNSILIYDYESDGFKFTDQLYEQIIHKAFETKQP